MSSVTRFIRQIPVSTTYYDAVNAQALAYAFVATPENYVGNYPPGVVQLASTGVPGSPGASLAGALAAAINFNTPAGVVLRDMGKTIYAAIADTASTPALATPAQFGYFREVQLIAPKGVGLVSNTLIGGTNGSTFGVIGPSPDYLTFYIPVTVAGVRGPASANVYAIAGGQM
jgi:hypothetical protein